MLFTFTKVVILIPFHCQVYSIKYKIKFVNDLWKVGEFIQILLLYGEEANTNPRSTAHALKVIHYTTDAVDSFSDDMA
jgi:hypothetical protein